MDRYKILGISGSLRQGSANTKLLREAARVFGDCAFELGDLRLPLYDGDDEAASGVPIAVQVLADQIAAADAIMVATPEYNKGPSGVLKNALDWVSRVKSKPWNNKPVAIMSASVGRSGGERAQMTLRGFMVPFRPRILQGPEIHLADCGNQFDENGMLIGEAYVRELTLLMQALRAEMDRQ